MPADSSTPGPRHTNKRYLPPYASSVTYPMTILRSSEALREGRTAGLYTPSGGPSVTSAIRSQIVDGPGDDEGVGTGQRDNYREPLRYLPLVR